jgi:hypothetical protein
MARRGVKRLVEFGQLANYPSATSTVLSAAPRSGARVEQ